MINNEETEKLMNEIRESESLYTYLAKFEKQNGHPLFVDYVTQLIKLKQIKKSQLIQNADLHRTYAYQILSGKKKPSRDKVIRLIFGLNPTIEEAQLLLKIAEYNPLYPKNKRDTFVIYAICNHLSLIELNSLLYDNDEEIIE